MILDNQTLLSDAQAITADAASTNTYDLGAANKFVAIGEPLGVFFTIDVAADAADADETYEFQVIQSANANLSSPDILIKTDTTYISRSTLVAGYKLVLPIPPGLVTKRYLGAYYNVGGTSPSVTVTAWIAPLSMAQNEKYYADGITIS